MPGPRLYPQMRRDFDAMLDRVEAAQSGTTEQTGYGVVEWLADVELANKFVETWWDTLTHQEQNAYAARVAYLKAVGKGIR
jgi:hypothetical protein